MILIFAVIIFRDSIGRWKSLQTRTGNRRQRVPGETMRLFHGFLSQIRMRERRGPGTDDGPRPDGIPESIDPVIHEDLTPREA